jgi:hypothetical protein
MPRHETRTFGKIFAEREIHGTKKNFKSVVPSVDATAGPLTITGAMLISGLLERDPNGLARTDLFPTGADLMAALKRASIDAYINMAWEFTWVNTADAAETITIGAAPVGCTYKPASLGTMAQNEAATFLIRILSVVLQTYAIYRMR